MAENEEHVGGGVQISASDEEDVVECIRCGHSVSPKNTVAVVHLCRKCLSQLLVGERHV